MEVVTLIFTIIFLPVEDFSLKSTSKDGCFKKRNHFQM